MDRQRHRTVLVTFIELLYFAGIEPLNIPDIVTCTPVMSRMSPQTPVSSTVTLQLAARNNSITSPAPSEPGNRQSAGLCFDFTGSTPDGHYLPCTRADVTPAAATGGIAELTQAAVGDTVTPRNSDVNDVTAAALVSTVAGDYVGEDPDPRYLDMMKSFKVAENPTYPQSRYHSRIDRFTHM